MFHDRSLLERSFRGFVLPVLEYCSAVWCSAAGTHLKQLDHAVSGILFLTGGVFECDIAHRRSVAVLCMLNKIRCNPTHPLHDQLPGPYLPVQVTRGALVAHRYTYAPPRSRTSQYRMTFLHLSVSHWNDLLNPYSMVWDWRVSRAGPMLFYWPKLLYPDYSLLLVFPFSSSCLCRLIFFNNNKNIGWYCGPGVFGLIGCVSLSLSASHCQPLLIIITIKRNQELFWLPTSRLIIREAELGIRELE